MESREGDRHPDFAIGGSVVGVSLTRMAKSVCQSPSEEDYLQESHFQKRHLIKSYLKKSFAEKASAGIVVIESR